MENASKALIIAGAILVSIILISLGIMVMNSTGDVTSRMGEEMNSASIQSFNSKFTQYAGEQKGSTIKNLMTTVDSSNAASDHDVGTISGVLGTTTAEVRKNAKPTTTYVVTPTDEDNDGYIDKIDISNKS